MPDKEKHRKRAMECIYELVYAMSMPENERKERYGERGLKLITKTLIEEVDTLANF